MTLFRPMPAAHTGALKDSQYSLDGGMLPRKTIQKASTKRVSSELDLAILLFVNRYQLPSPETLLEAW